MFKTRVSIVYRRLLPTDLGCHCDSLRGHHGVTEGHWQPDDQRLYHQSIGRLSASRLVCDCRRGAWMGSGGEREGQGSRCPIALTAGYLKDERLDGTARDSGSVDTVTVPTAWCGCRGLKVASACFLRLDIRPFTFLSRPHPPPLTHTHTASPPTKLTQSTDTRTQHTSPAKNRPSRTSILSLAELLNRLGTRDFLAFGRDC